MAKRIGKLIAVSIILPGGWVAPIMALIALTPAGKTFVHEISDRYSFLKKVLKASGVISAK